MPTIVFVQPDGVRREIEAPVGITLMEVARQHDVLGVVAQCGGACACATCHVYIESPWLSKLEPREEMEEGMLETAWEPRENSRLSCQVHITADLNGLEVTVPNKQNSD
jgi:ferredoxin, 2Fe-2S